MIYTPKENLIIGYKGYYIGQIISEETYKQIEAKYKNKFEEFNIINDFE